MPLTNHILYLEREINHECLSGVLFFFFLTIEQYTERSPKAVSMMKYLPGEPPRNVQFDQTVSLFFCFVFKITTDIRHRSHRHPRLRHPHHPSLPGL